MFSESQLENSQFMALERPMLALDNLLSEFANVWNARITYNYHNVPNRQIFKTGDSRVKKMVELAVVIAGVATMDNPQYFLTASSWCDFSTRRRCIWSKRFAQLAVDEVVPERVSPVLRDIGEILDPIDEAFLIKHGTMSLRPA